MPIIIDRTLLERNHVVDLYGYFSELAGIASALDCCCLGKTPDLIAYIKSIADISHECTKILNSAIKVSSLQKVL